MINYLMHYGVKDQKWGVRRYQDKEGHHTPLGRERDRARKRRARTMTRADTIKFDKGKQMVRYANSGEPIDDRRKYVSGSPSDDTWYKEKALEGLLDLHEDEPISRYMYEAKRDLYVAPAERVMDDVMKTYGDVEMNAFYKSIKYRTETTYEYDKTEKMLDFIQDKTYDNMDEILSKYQRKGYDAIVDVEDWINGRTMPLVVMNPKDNLNLLDERKIKR